MALSIGGGVYRRWAELSQPDLQQLLMLLTGPGAGGKEEFVTDGGVPWGEGDRRTLQSRLCPGLYLAGEVLDGDGLTGGLDLQAPWTMGWVAGWALGRTGDG